jgi:hypothetical protein
MAKPSRAKVKRSPWHTFALLAASVYRRDGRMLGLVVDPGSGVVLAFEGPAPTVGKGSLQTLETFFGDHAHAIVSTGGASLAEAVLFAEAYAERWMRGELERVEPCACPEIQKGAANG